MATIRVDATVKRGIHDAGRGESLGRSVGVLIFDVIKTSAEVCFPDLIFIRVVAHEAVGDGPLLMLDLCLIIIASAKQTELPVGDCDRLSMFRREVNGVVLGGGIGGERQRRERGVFPRAAAQTRDALGIGRIKNAKSLLVAGAGAP